MMRSFQWRLMLLGFIAGTLTMAVVGCGGGGGGGSMVPVTPPVPNAPSSVYSLADSGKVTLRWGAVPYATSYIVLRSTVSATDLATFTVVASAVPSALYTDTAVTNDVPYYYVVKSRGASGTSGPSAPVTATPKAAAGSTLSGTVRYEDKEYNEFGFTGNILLKAVRHARVELISAATGSVLNSMVTSATGTFSFDVSTLAGQTVYVRAEADGTPANGNIVVKNIAGNIYAKKSGSLTVVSPMAADLSFVAPVSSAGGAFNILDVYTNASDFVGSVDLATIPTLTVYWPSAPNFGTYYCSENDGTAYCAQGEGIYVLSDQPASPDYDTDEYDDDVLAHEYGHFIARHFSKDQSPGGTHAYWVNDYDLRLAWSEGWGNFFETAVKDWLDHTDRSLLSIDAGTPISQYVDTATIPHHYYISLTLETPEVQSVPNSYCGLGSPDECYYASNEIAVANVLWKHLNVPNFGMQPIWDTFISLPTATPVNLEAFWDGWLTLRGVGTGSPELVTLNDIYGSRSIFYHPDSYETDDSLLSAGTYSTVPQGHTLYSEVSATHLDEDFVTVAATAGAVYTVTTSSLRNGAAPAVEVFGTDGTTVIAQSDPSLFLSYDALSGFWYMNSTNLCDSLGCHVNTVSTLKSTVSFSSPVDGNVTIRIRPSDNRRPASGTFGSYILTVTQ